MKRERTNFKQLCYVFYNNGQVQNKQTKFLAILGQQN